VWEIVMRHALLIGILELLPLSAFAHFAGFKSPGPGMHFTVGQPVIVFADLFDDNDGHGMIICPAGQTPIVPAGGGAATCSGGGTPVGWPQLQVLVDGAAQTDSVTHGTTVPGSTDFDSNGNPDPIDFYRFSVTGMTPGTHQMVIRGHFAPPPASNGATVDSTPIAITIDALPAGRTTLTLNADVTGTINWNNLIVIGNGHRVHANGAVSIVNTLVTGLGSPSAAGIDGTASNLSIRNSVFESTAALDLTAAASAVVRNSEWRANNLLTFVASDPDASPIITLRGNGIGAKLFQGNNIGAGRVEFRNTSNWLIGGDTDADTNIIIGPRATLYPVDSSSNITVRGNYDHHNYRGGWSQGFNFSWVCNFCGSSSGTVNLIEHNVIRGGSWPLQSVSGELRYNLIYGYGHTWLRSAGDNGASIHHNVFAPEKGGGDQNQGIWFYDGETNIQVYNNTFDGGGGGQFDFAGPTIQVNNTSHVDSIRNNLVTYSRNYENTPGDPRIVGDAGTIGQADYNAFYSPDNTTKDNYAIAGVSEPAVGAHDASGAGTGVLNGQLAATPFSAARIDPYETLVDEGAVWNRTQKVSTILAAFRAHYMPAAGSPVVNAGDPADNDAQSRRTDIGAIDRDGHDDDQFGKFGVDEIFANGFEVTTTVQSDRELHIVDHTGDHWHCEGVTRASPCG
jgi:hypothetical protein